MHFFATFACTLVVLVASQEMGIGEFLDKYKHINMDELLENDRLFKANHNCMMDRGTCTSFARELKKNVPFLMKKGCGSCTPDQKATLKKYLVVLEAKRLKEWNEFLNKVDPTRENYKRITAQLKVK